nr:hypothetical protein [Tanacetum cinerariifolium]
MKTVKNARKRMKSVEKVPKRLKRSKMDVKAICCSIAFEICCASVVFRYACALKSLIISLHLLAGDRGGGECGGDYENMKDEKYEESDDEDMEVLDENEEINDGDDFIKSHQQSANDHYGEVLRGIEGIKARKGVQKPNLIPAPNFLPKRHIKAVQNLNGKRVFKSGINGLNVGRSVDNVTPNAANHGRV